MKKEREEVNRHYSKINIAAISMIVVVDAIMTVSINLSRTTGFDK